MPFHRAAVPRQRQTGGDGVLVAAQAGDEGVQSWLVVGVDGGHPPLQLMTAQVAHHGGPDMAGQRGEGCADRQDRIEPVLIGRPDGRRVAHDPACDATNRRRLRCRSGNVTAGAERMQVLAHDLLAAAIAPGLDLSEQLGGIGAPLVEALV